MSECESGRLHVATGSHGSSPRCSLFIYCNLTRRYRVTDCIPAHCAAVVTSDTRHKFRRDNEDLEIRISGIPVRGVEIDSRTGCVHYRSAIDIVAIKFNCCQTYYSCFYCHQAETGHPAQTWSHSEFEEKAILCGACGTELTIRQYLECRAICPMCGAAFNPRCELHYPLYFEP